MPTMFHCLQVWDDFLDWLSENKLLTTKVQDTRQHSLLFHAVVFTLSAFLFFYLSNNRYNLGHLHLTRRHL